MNPKTEPESPQKDPPHAAAGSDEPDQPGDGNTGDGDGNTGDGDGKEGSGNNGNGKKRVPTRRDPFLNFYGFIIVIFLVQQVCCRYKFHPDTNSQSFSS